MHQEKMTFRITDTDILNCENINREQVILELLKRIGAPIEGTIYFKINTRYNVKVSYDNIKNESIYEFKRIENVS